MRKCAVVSCLSLFFLPLAQHAQGAVIYRPNEGWSFAGDNSGTIEGSALEQMRKAEKLDAAQDLQSALSAYRGLLKRYGDSEFAPKAQLKIGSVLERQGEWEKAYDAYDTYLTRYPRGDDLDRVLESMFKIGKLFLEGQRKKVFGVPLAPSMNRAREMFEGMIKRAPFSKWAPLAQFNIGQAYEKSGDYAAAITAYQAVASKYSTEPIAADALYQVGYVRLNQYRKGSYDRLSAQKAREAFEDFLNRYPTSEKAAQARQNIQSLEKGSAEGTLGIAKFYDKTKNYKAAIIYYNDVVATQPDSPESAFAKSRIAALKAQFGEAALQAGPERVETGAKVQSRRKMQAQIDTVSRPDYVGPPVTVPEPEEATPASRLKLRTSPQTLVPLPSSLEPPLPEALPKDPSSPKPPE
jgi:outer membrane protein assembly factor BamD